MTVHLWSVVVDHMYWGLCCVWGQANIALSPSKALVFITTSECHWLHSSLYTVHQEMAFRPAPATITCHQAGLWVCLSHHPVRRNTQVTEMQESKDHTHTSKVCDLFVRSIFWLNGGCVWCHSHQLEIVRWMLKADRSKGCLGPSFASWACSVLSSQWRGGGGGPGCPGNQRPLKVMNVPLQPGLPCVSA